MAVTVNDMQSYYEQAIKRLGVPALLMSSKGSFPDKMLQVGLKTAGFQDIEVINAYGIGTRIITFLASDFQQFQAPHKFDQIKFADDEIVVLSAVFTVDLHTVGRIGYKAYAKQAGS